MAKCKYCQLFNIWLAVSCIEHIQNKHTVEYQNTQNCSFFTIVFYNIAEDHRNVWLRHDGIWKHELFKNTKWILMTLSLSFKTSKIEIRLFFSNEYTIQCWLKIIVYPSIVCIHQTVLVWKKNTNRFIPNSKLQD